MGSSVHVTRGTSAAYAPAAPREPCHSALTFDGRMTEGRNIKVVAVITAGIAMAVVIPILLARGGAAPSIPVEGYRPFSVSWSASMVSSLMLFISYGFAVYAGFELDWKWGVANLIIPFAVFVFMLLHWRNAKDSLMFLGIGMLFFIIEMAFQ